MGKAQNKELDNENYLLFCCPNCGYVICFDALRCFNCGETNLPKYYLNKNCCEN